MTAGHFHHSGAEEEVVCGRVSLCRDGDGRGEGDAGGEDGLEVVGGGLDVGGGGDGVDDEAVIAVDDGGELKVVAEDACGGAGELEALRIDPVVDAVIAIGLAAEGGGEEVVPGERSAGLEDFSLCRGQIGRASCGKE